MAQKTIDQTYQVGNEPAPQLIQVLSPLSNQNISKEELQFSVYEEIARLMLRKIFNRKRASRGTVQTIAEILEHMRGAFYQPEHKVAEHILTTVFCLNPMPDDKLKAVGDMVRQGRHEADEAYRILLKHRKARTAAVTKKKRAELWAKKDQEEAKAETKAKRASARKAKKAIEEETLISDIRGAWTQ